MRKVLASLVFGAALLAPCGSAFAEANRPPESRWGIRPEKNSPTLLDLARWLSDRLRQVAFAVEPEPAPAPVPVPSPDPGPAADVVCPDRIHCPIG